MTVRCVTPKGNNPKIKEDTEYEEKQFCRRIRTGDGDQGTVPRGRKGRKYGRTGSCTDSEAQERGNAYIDLNDTIWDDQVPALIGNLREYGIEKFTFSSTWSSAVETAWLFTQNGCRLEGLVEINGRHKAFMSDEYEKAHGYLFSIGDAEDK